MAQELLDTFDRDLAGVTLRQRVRDRLAPGRDLGHIDCSDRQTRARRITCISDNALSSAPLPRRQPLIACQSEKGFTRTKDLPAGRHLDALSRAPATLASASSKNRTRLPAFPTAPKQTQKSLCPAWRNQDRRSTAHLHNQFADAGRRNLNYTVSIEKDRLYFGHRRCGVEQERTHRHNGNHLPRHRFHGQRMACPWRPRERVVAAGNLPIKRELCASTSAKSISDAVGSTFQVGRCLRSFLGRWSIYFFPSPRKNKVS